MKNLKLKRKIYIQNMLIYTEKEKNEKNYLLENIRQIQKISQIIPNYQSFIQNSGLIKYLL